MMASLMMDWIASLLGWLPDVFGNDDTVIL